MEFEEDGEGGSKICDNPKIISKFKWKILSSDLPKPTLKKMTNLNFVRRNLSSWQFVIRVLKLDL